MAESLVYVRTKVRSPRKNQRVRLTVVAAAPAAGGVFNLTSRFGEYARTSVRNDRVVFAYSHFPTPPFEFQTEVISDGLVSEPRFAWDSRRILSLIYSQGIAVVERVSWDDGLTWGEEAILAIGTTPDIVCSPAGVILRAWNEASGEIHFGLQQPGETGMTVSGPVGDGFSPFLFEIDTFRFIWDLRGWLWLHARPLGLGTTRLYYSTDEGDSFSTTSGAVTGIASGAHPGMTFGPDGMGIAYAYAAGTLKATRRFPGDAAWGTAFTVNDDAAAALLVADAASSMAMAYEGPNRLVLTTTVTGESTPADLWSSDQGASFKRFA